MPVRGTPAGVQKDILAPPGLVALVPVPLFSWLLCLPVGQLSPGQVIIHANAELPEATGCFESSMLFSDCPELDDHKPAAWRTDGSNACYCRDGLLRQACMLLQQLLHMMGQSPPATGWNEDPSQHSIGLTTFTVQPLQIVGSLLVTPICRRAQFCLRCQLLLSALGPLILQICTQLFNCLPELHILGCKLVHSLRLQLCLRVELKCEGLLQARESKVQFPLGYDLVQIR